MSIIVTILDEQTGDEDVTRVPDGDYLLIATDPCTYGVQAYANGTHVITVKGRRTSSNPETGHAPDGASKASTGDAG